MFEIGVSICSGGVIVVIPMLIYLLVAATKKIPESHIVPVDNPYLAYILAIGFVLIAAGCWLMHQERSNGWVNILGIASGGIAVFLFIGHWWFFGSKRKAAYRDDESAS